MKRRQRYNIIMSEELEIFKVEIKGDAVGSERQHEQQQSIIYVYVVR
jgi:hypothetical protein